MESKSTNSIPHIIWFMGTGHFAELCLDGLTRRNIHIHRVITGLPTRSGRSGKENPSPVELKACELGLPVSRTGKLTENQELLSALEAESPAVIFVIDFGQIIREPFLSRMCLNIHPSLLPEYRGAAPIQRALLDGKTYTGVTLFRLVQAMDAGGIAAQERVEISPSENASDLYARLAEIGCTIAANVVNDLEGITFTPQDDSLATFAPKLAKEEFALTFGMTAQRFVDTVRALDMSGGAYAVIRGKRVKVWRASVRDDLKGENPGQVLETKGCPVAACADCGVELLEVQSEGRNRTSGAEWARGIRIHEGDVL